MLKYVDEYRDVDLCLDIAERIRGISSRPFNIMEVCGGHTMSIRKNGIQKMIGENINLISGPGCPVCVTSIEDIDKAVALSEIDNVVICTFGDMMRVPGTNRSFIEAKSEGSDIRLVYSAQDVLKYAKEDTDRRFVFVGIGFETTTPTIAAAIKQAKSEGVNNFSVLVFNKTMPEALEAVLGSDDSKIDALICPGHVSTITGTDMYEPIVEKHEISCCVSGFEPADILRAVYILTDSFERKDPVLVNAYERVVLKEGNIKAKDIIKEVFEPADSEWRGLGIIPGSGYRIKEEYSAYDAERIFDISVPLSKKYSGCICGDVLRGAKTPGNCALFGKICTPEDPKGACMVSSEGTCAAWYKYGE